MIELALRSFYSPGGAGSGLVALGCEAGECETGECETGEWLFFVGQIFAHEEAVGNGFGLDGGQDDMARIRDDDGSGAAAIGSVDELPPIACIGDDTLNGGRFWTHNRNDTIGRDDIPKPNVD